MKIFEATIFLLTILLSMHMNAQTSIETYDSTIKFDKEQRPCLQLNLDPEPKTLKDAWRDYLKDNYDFKLKGIGFLSNKDLLSAEEIMVPKISPKTMDFYTNIVEDENGSEMKIFARHGYDIYINKKNYPDEYDALREVIDGFIKQYLPKYYEGRVSDTQDRIKKLEDETKDLKKDINDGTERIAKLKKEIENLEKKLGTNNEALKIANKKLIKRNEKLERIKKQIRKL